MQTLWLLIAYFIGIFPTAFLHSETSRPQNVDTGCQPTQPPVQ